MLALYFFHLCDGGDVLLDPDGRDIAEASAIPDIALREARAVIAQEALTGRIVMDQFIEIRDDAGKLVHSIQFRDAVTIG